MSPFYLRNFYSFNTCFFLFITLHCSLLASRSLVKTELLSALQTITMVQASVFVSTDLVDPIAKLVRELPHLDNALILYTPHMYVLKILAIKVMNVKSELVYI